VSFDGHHVVLIWENQSRAKAETVENMGFLKVKDIFILVQVFSDYFEFTSIVHDLKEVWNVFLSFDDV
jgi:hypothetical protein